MTRTTQADVAQQMEEAVERYERGMKVLQPFFEAWCEALAELYSKVCEALRPLLAALLAWWEEVRREELYRRLRRWRFPEWLARFLARRWPERWLPGPEV